MPDPMTPIERQNEMSIDFEAHFEPAPGIDRVMKRIAALRRPIPPSFRMARWPNELGDTPEDAIGKEVVLSWDSGDEQRFVVDHVEGESLVLAHAWKPA